MTLDRASRPGISATSSTAFTNPTVQEREKARGSAWPSPSQLPQDLGGVISATNDPTGGARVYRGASSEPHDSGRRFAVEKNRAFASQLRSFDP